MRAAKAAKTRRRQMERIRKLRNGLRAATVVVFFAAALLSTGCSNNALMNPQIDSANGGQTANSAGSDIKPAGSDIKP
jgi:hypothetical protein